MTCSGSIPCGDDGIRACTPAREAAAELLGSRLREVSRLLRRASGKPGRKARCVHQLRVSTRRAAAALRVFGALVEGEPAEAAQRRLKKIRRRAAAARKCDALRDVLEDVSKDLEGAERAAAERVMRVLGRRRREARRELRGLLERWGRKGLRRWREAVETSCRERANGASEAGCSLADLAPVALGAPIDALREAGIGARTIESMHQLRLAGKRVRYAVEVLSPALDAAALGEATAHLTTLQERLGEVNDLSELIAEVAAIKDRLEGDAAVGCERAAERAAGAAALMQRLAARRASTQEAFIAWWEGGERAALLDSLAALARAPRPAGAASEGTPRIVVRAVEPARVLNGAGA